MTTSAHDTPSRPRGASPRRGAATAALVTFWAALLLALGVPWAGPILLAALAGAAIVVARSLWHGVASPAPDRLTAAPAQALGVLRRLGRLAGTAFERTRRRVRRPPLVLAPAGTTDRAAEAWRFCRTGAALRQEGRPAEAVECCETAVWLFRDLDEPRGLARALNALGLAFVRQGRPEAAIAAYEEAAEILGALGEPHAQGQVLANLGAAHRSRGRQEEARASWQHALTRLEPGSAEHARTGRELRAAG
jgi:tetratricopeptide (TPR) repeat protein